MNIGYLIYQAERPLSGTEQRAVDASRGEIARGLSRLFHLAHTAPASRVACPQGKIAVPDYPPAEWVRCAQDACGCGI
jgi:hypothetical protein